jgi:hypothetical protein
VRRPGMTVAGLARQHPSSLRAKRSNPEPGAKAGLLRRKSSSQ